MHFNLQAATGFYCETAAGNVYNASEVSYTSNSQSNGMNMPHVDTVLQSTGWPEISSSEKSIPVCKDMISAPE